VLVQLADPLFLHALSFLAAPELGPTLAASKRLHALASSNTLWRPLCQANWPAMMRQLARGLDEQPHSYRKFFVKNRRSLYHARRESEHLHRSHPTDDQQQHALSAITRYTRYFQSLVLLVDVRDETTGASVFSKAIPLTCGNVATLFKPKIHARSHYAAAGASSIEKALFCPRRPLEAAASALLADDEEQPGEPEEASKRLRFDLTLYNKRTKAMATLGSGTAEATPVHGLFGPRFQPTGRRFAFFGEGAEFLSAVPLFAWFFVEEDIGEGSAAAAKGSAKWLLQCLAIEVVYTEQGTLVETPDRGTEQLDAGLFRCLYDAFRHELVWV
jgi:hypothetical protein